MITTILVLNGSETKVVVIVADEVRSQRTLPSTEQLVADLEKMAKVPAPSPEYEDQVCSTAGGFIGAGELASRTASGPIEWLRPVQLASTYG